MKVVGNQWIGFMEPIRVRLSDINSDAARGMAAEAWLSARRVPVQSSAIGSCNGRDFQATDAAFIRRGDINALDARFAAGVAQSIDADHLEVIVLEAAADRAVATERRAEARRSNARRAAEGRPGAGYLIFDNQSSTACYVSEDNAPQWQRAMEGQTADLQLDLGIRLPLRLVQLGSNDAFIAGRRGECRIIVGEAQSINRIATAAQRDRVVAQFGAVWLEQANLPSASTSAGASAAQGSGTARATSDVLLRLEAAGSSSDLLLLVNTTNSAPHAAVNLAGDIRFTSPRAELCIVSSLQPTLAQELALEDWLGSRQVPFSAANRAACATQEFGTLDGILLRRGEMTRLNPILFNGLARAAGSRGVQAQVVLSEADESMTRDGLATAATRNSASISAGRPGIGLILFEGTGRQFCVVTEHQGATLERVLRPHVRALELDAGQRGPFNFSPQDLDTAFIATRQRQACRGILAPAPALQQVLAASERDGLAHRVGAMWLTTDAFSQGAAEIARDAAEAARQARAREVAAAQERQQGEIRDRNLGIERARRTEELRNSSRARAVSMQDATRESLRALFGRQDPAPATWASQVFADLARQARLRRAENWQLEAVESTVHEFGLGQWSGRKLDTAVIRSEIRLRNADVGRYETVCVLTAYMEDVEFNRFRLSEQTGCGADGATRIDRWLSGIGFESRWNAP